MKPMQRLLVQVVVGILSVVAAPVVFGQTGMGQGKGMPMYDMATVVTVKGTVQDVQEGMMQSGQMGQMKGMSGMEHMGMHLVLKTENQTLTVLVGPARFVKEKNFAFAKGDQIEVTGSKVKSGDTETIIAREIKKGDKVLTLRNEKGVPEWSMGGRR